MKRAAGAKYNDDKKAKGVIANVVHVGSQLRVFNEIMAKTHVQLQKNQAFVAAAANCVSHISDILTNVCFVKDIDAAELSAYFYVQFAVIRNRKANAAKKKL